MEDQTNPFNSKLALRLGLTHHIIYACYLFKYYKVLDYQLITSNLLLNIFRSIEGVTANAISHANFLLIKSLIDCDQLILARNQLKQAVKSSNYTDRSHYESILLHCVACELNFLEGSEDIYNSLDELAELALIRPDDKLQHYYARTLAISIILKYIQCYPSKSDQCLEFFHTFRYICAIIRRCYESSFDLVIAEKGEGRQQIKESDTKQTQILDHSWIRYAVCDFVFATFDHLSDFYARAGMPECLELLYNGLNLISFRNGGLYWQSRIIAIGVRLDLLCDKYDHAKEKLDILSRIVSYTNDPHSMNVLRLESEVSLMGLLNEQGSVISNDVIKDILKRIEACKNQLLDKLDPIELFDSKSNTYVKLINLGKNLSETIFLGNYLGRMSLSTLKIGINSLLRSGSTHMALDLMMKLNEQLELSDTAILDYFSSQIILETLIQFADVANSEPMLLSAITNSHLFLEIEDKLSDLQQQLSSLTLTSEPDKDLNLGKKASVSRRGKVGKKSQIPLSRMSRRKKTYEVATRSKECLTDKPIVKLYNTIETVRNLSTLTKEELVVSYLRNSEPNPDYHLYRRAHELMFCFRLADEHHDLDVLLYHFTESSTSNTMRYRWMMFEEQQISPYTEAPKLSFVNGDNLKYSSPVRQLGFCNSWVNQEKIIKSMTRTIPDGTRLVQFKYIAEKSTNQEHLLCTSFNNDNDPIFVHVKRSITTDDFFDDAKKLEFEPMNLSIPNRLALEIEESKKSLLSGNHRSRTETRHKIETEIGLILRDIEDDWLGPFRFLLSGNTYDSRYSKFVFNLANELQSTIMKDRVCRSDSAFRLVLESAPLLGYEEFRKMMMILFNCESDTSEPRHCFNTWLKSIESFMKEHRFVSDKTNLLQKLGLGQLGLMLDSKLEVIPFESLPIARTTGQGIFRTPSLRLFSIIVTRRCTPIKIDSKDVAYILDPASNLPKTRERFDQKLRSQSTWQGTIGKPPKIDELDHWLSRKQLYLFIGHGAGTAYYNRLCKGRGLSSMAHVESASIVMGCSSGRMLAEGPRLETFGIGWVFIFRGSPCYVGLLWDVTDNDIDKYLDCLLDRWMPSLKWSSASGGNSSSIARPTSGGAITEASTKARHACQLKLLVGAAPVVYGLPIWCKS